MNCAAFTKYESVGRSSNTILLNFVMGGIRNMLAFAAIHVYLGLMAFAAIHVYMGLIAFAATHVYMGLPALHSASQGHTYFFCSGVVGGGGGQGEVICSFQRGHCDLRNEERKTHVL